MALTKAQESFAEKVAKATGLQIQTVRTWVAQENGPDDNPLNIMGWTSSGNRYVRHFGSVTKAVTATVNLLRTPTYAAVTSAAVKYDTPEPELRAIASSPWEENQYMGKTGTLGGDLLNTFRSLYGGSSADTPDAASVAVPSMGVTQNAAWYNPGDWAGDAFSWIWDKSGFDTLTGWLEGELAKAFAYAALTFLALAIGGLGVLRMLGASPGGLARTIAPAKKAASGSQSDDIPF